MRKELLFLIFFCLAAAGTYAQRDSCKWVIRINTGAFISISNISIEKTLGKKSTGLISPSYWYLRSEKVTYETYGIGAQYRYYFLKHNVAPKGFYTAGGLSYAHGRAIVETNNNERTDVSGYNIQALAGKQWILKNGIAFDANVGIQYIKLDFKNDRYTGGYNGWLPALGAGVGYAF